jgi:AcrR family transcriptional regulator
MPSELELDADQIVAAAVEIMRESGLDAISMRSVASRLGVTPPPVYSRIGNKDALLDAVAEHVLDDLAPNLERGENWPDYARRWTRQLRARLTDAADSRLFLQAKRPAYLKASRPLLKSMRRDRYVGSRLPFVDLGDGRFRRHRPSAEHQFDAPTGPPGRQRPGRGDPRGGRRAVRRAHRLPDRRYPPRQRLNLRR